MASSKSPSQYHRESERKRARASSFEPISARALPRHAVRSQRLRPGAVLAFAGLLVFVLLGALVILLRFAR